MDNQLSLEIKISLAEIAGEQRLQSQRLDHMSEMLEKDVAGLKADNNALRRDMLGMVSKDRFLWVEKSAYLALAAIVGAWIKIATGG